MGIKELTLVQRGALGSSSEALRSKSGSRFTLAPSARGVVLAENRVSAEAERAALQRLPQHDGIPTHLIPAPLPRKFVRPFFFFFFSFLF